MADINDATAADLAPLDSDFWSKQQEELSSQGLRVLALCRCVVHCCTAGFQAQHTPCRLQTVCTLCCGRTLPG